MTLLLSDILTALMLFLQGWS